MLISIIGSDRIQLLLRNAEQIKRIVKATYPGLYFDNTRKGLECAKPSSPGEHLACRWEGVVSMMESVATIHPKMRVDQIYYVRLLETPNYSYPADCSPSSSVKHRKRCPPRPLIILSRILRLVIHSLLCLSSSRCSRFLLCGLCLTPPAFSSQSRRFSTLSKCLLLLTLKKSIISGIGLLQPGSLRSSSHHQERTGSHGSYFIRRSCYSLRTE